MGSGGESHSVLRHQAQTIPKNSRTHLTLAVVVRVLQAWGREPAVKLRHEVRHRDAIN